MDHIVNKILEYAKSDFVEFAKEWDTGKYKYLSQCPGYYTVQAYCDAVNVLSRCSDSAHDPLTPKDIVEEELGIALKL